MKLTRDLCIEKLKEIGQHSPGTLEEIKMKLKKFSFYPELSQRLKLTRDLCIEKMKEIGQHSPGTLEEIKMKLNKFSFYPELYQRLKLKAQQDNKFQCSLDLNEVPSISAKWCLYEKFYPAVNDDVFNAYCSFKHPGNKGQQEKALCMLQNRKLVSVKTL